MKKIFFLLSVFVLLNVVVPQKSYAQCAMCKENAEAEAKKNHVSGGGINIGIMYLLILPYALVGSIGYYWYWRNKKAKEAEEEN